MELRSDIFTSKFEMPEELIHEVFCLQLPPSFSPLATIQAPCIEGEVLSLLTLNLYKTLDWLHSHPIPKPLEKEVCSIPVLLYVPKFSAERLLFHYDGTPQSAELIRKFIRLFSNLISASKATIISPSFIPKSKIKEEQEIIQLVTEHTQETSFIKFNFSRIGDFWSYAVKHQCTLLVTTKNYQSDLAKVLYHFYKGKIWSEQLSFYLSL